MSQCKQLKKDGYPCRSMAISGGEYCFRHHPEFRLHALEASRKGGISRRLASSYFSPTRIKNPGDIQKLIELTMKAVLTGAMPANNPANSIGFLSRCWLDAYEKSELESRIYSIERKLDVQ